MSKLIIKIGEIKRKFDDFALVLWVKWFIFSENMRLKAEKMIYEWDKKL